MVSIIITTFGANQMLIRAINSVLKQSYTDFEIIIIDDNNPDTQERMLTEKMMHNFIGDDRIRYLKHSKNMNGAVARNTGIAAARGNYIAFLDDDDFYLKDRVKNAVHYLDNHAEIDGVCAEVAKTKNGYLVDLMHVENEHVLTFEDILISKQAIGSGSNLFLRKSIVDKVFGFDVTFKRKQDIEFILRILQNGKVVYLHDFEIVKDVSGVRTLSYKNNYEALEKFDKKFSDVIGQLPEEQRKQYYLTQYKFLYSIAQLNGDKGQIEEAKSNLLHYDYNAESTVKQLKKDSLKNKIINFTEHSIFNSLVVIAKNRKYKKIDMRIRTSIPDDKYVQISQYLNLLSNE